MLGGGAGIAAYRIHQGLLKAGANGIESYVVQRDAVEDADSNVYGCTHYHDLYYRIVNRLGLKSSLTNEEKYRKTIAKYPRNYETVTLPYSYFPIEEHPIIKNADVVHLHWVGGFLNYPTFFEKIKKPIVWTLHDENPFLGLFHYEGDMERNKSNLGELDNHISKKKISYIQRKDNLYIVTPSEWLKEKSEKSKALGRYHHYLIPYGFDLSNYPLLDQQQAKNSLSLDNNKKTILFVASKIDIYRKGIDILTEALKNIDPSKFNLISVGMKGEMPINDKINHKHIDHVNDISQLNIVYAAADMTILPSREDNLPNVMIESFLNGTPVASFSNGGMAEHIRTGENGILINEISAENLKKAIEDFLENKYTFNRENIREYSVQNFSSKLQTRRYIDLYNNILHK